MLQAWRWLVLTAALLAAWQWWTKERAVHQPGGTLVSAAPRQVDLDQSTSFEALGRTLVRRARYDLTVRVLRKEIYRLGDAAGLAPVDLAVAWGRMSDNAMLDAIAITQMGRFFYWRPRHPDTFQVPRDALVAQMAQIHAIPATAAVDAALRRLRPGQIATLGGYLVDVRGPGGFAWNTSLTRTDVGDGACEIMWIETLQLD